MNTTFSMFILAFLILAMIVMIILGFMSGGGSPLPWVAMAVLLFIPYLHNRMMSKRFIEWKNEYSVGIEAIDNDHKQLINLINQLNTAVHYSTGEAFERQALDALVDYTRNHFAREEKLMADNAYPDFEAHKAKHEAMISRVGEFIEAYQTDNSKTMEDVLDYLKDWLIKHINGTDQEYSEFLTSRGVH